MAQGLRSSKYGEKCDKMHCLNNIIEETLSAPSHCRLAVDWTKTWLEGLVFSGGQWVDEHWPTDVGTKVNEDKEDGLQVMVSPVTYIIWGYE